MKKKGTKQRIAVLTVLLAATLFFGCFGFVPATAQEGHDSSLSGVDNGRYDEYTDFDIHEDVQAKSYISFYGSRVTLEERLHSIPAETEGEEAQTETLVYLCARENDLITQFIPEELFRSEGKTYYLGREYGFIVDTFQVEGDSALHSIVLLIDIITEDDLGDTFNHLRIAASPVFQGEFAYITPDTEKICGTAKNEEAIYTGLHRGDVFIDTDGSYVIPVPTVSGQKADSVDKCSFEEVHKYYLKNFSSLVSLYNEHHLNQFDEGYVASEDEGAIISQIDCEYSGHTLGKNDHVEEIKDIAVGAVTLGLDVFGIVPTIITAAVDIINLIQDVRTYMNSESSFMVPAGEKKLTFIPDYTNAEQQLQNYGYLRKDAYMEIVPTGEEEMLLTTGDLARADFQITPGNIAWDTRYVSVLSLEAYVPGENEETVEFTSTGYSNVFDYGTEPEFFDAAENKAIDYYLLPGGEQTLQFMPERSGFYTLKLETKESYLSSLRKRSGGDIEAEFISDQNAYRAYLEEGIVYRWGASFADQHALGSLTGKIYFDPMPVQLGNNTLAFEQSKEEYIQICFPENYYYTLTCSEPGVCLRAYDDDYNLIIEGNDSVRVACGGNKPVFVSVSAESAISQNISLSLSREREVSLVSYAEEIENHILTDGEEYVLPVPEGRIGYNFAGWWNDALFEGDRVTDVWQIDKADIILYAKWIPIQYTLTLVDTVGGDSVLQYYTIEDFVKLESGAEKEGFLFIGWYDNSSFEGDPITQIPQGSYGNRIYYGKWVRDTYTVTLDLNAGEADGQNVILSRDGTVTSISVYDVGYGTQYVLPIAETEGFTFLGWYLGEIRFTNQTGDSLKKFTEEQDITLTAAWSRDEYTVKIVINDQKSVYLISGGLSELQDTISYSVDLCPNCMITALRNSSDDQVRSKVIEILYREGHKFSHFMSEENRPDLVACWDENPVNLVDGAVYTIYAYYTKEDYDLYFNMNDSKYFDDAEVVHESVSYDSVVSYPEISGLKNGYNFLGWYWGSELFDYAYMPDLTKSEEKDGSASLVPKIEAIDYAITLEYNGGILQSGETAPSQYSVESGAVILPVPVYTGFRFMGWYESADFIGDPVEMILEGETGNKTFYAKWEQEYLVRIILSDGSVDQKFYLINGETFNLPTKSELDPKGERVHYDGNFIAKSEEGVLEQSFALGQTVIFDYNKNLDFILEWSGKIYNIYYVNMQNAGGVKWTYEYGTTTMLPDPVLPVYDKSVFHGYYKDSDFNLRVTNISATEYGDLTLYMKWDLYLGSVSSTAEEKITDSGRWNQPYEAVPIALREFSQIKDGNYISIKFKLKLDVWEIDDGLQYIFLYDEYSSKSGKLLWEVKINNISGGKNTKPTTLEFEFSVPIEEWPSSNVLTFYFLFGASGDWDDDWKYSDFDLMFYLSADEPDATTDNYVLIKKDGTIEYS